MHKEKGIRLRQLYGICLSGILAVSAACLIGACIHIYRSGAEPYSPQSVAEAFSYIAVPIWLCLGMLLVGALGNLLFPLASGKLKPNKQYALILHNLNRTADLSKCTPEQTAQLLRLRKQRKTRRILAVMSVLIGIFGFSLFLLTADRFPLEDINGSVVRAVLVLLPCMALPFAMTLYAVIANRNSIQTEIALLKQLPRLAAPLPSEKPHHSPLPVPAIRLAVLVLGVGILVFGFLTGGTADVLVKAINICTECVGLG